jgi:hypothetical protein
MSQSKSFLLLLNLAIMFAGCGKQLTITPTNKPTNFAVIGDKLKGVIFTESYIITPAPPTVAAVRRFTPTKDDIILAEYLIKDQIKDLNKDRINQIKGNPIIEKHLKSYFRQYIGFITSNGDSIIHINFHWNRYSLSDRLKGYHDDRLNFEDDFTRTFDGGSYYWQIKVNLTKQLLYDLGVNSFG